MSLKDVVVDFCENTSCHSLDRVGDKQRKCWVRLIWFIIFIVCVCVLISQLVQLVLRYERREVIVDTVLEFRELTLPAVTVCNMNMMPKNKVLKVKDTRLDGLLQLYSKVFSENFTTTSQNFCSAQPQELKKFCEETVNGSFIKAEIGGKNRTTFKPTLYWQSVMEVALPLIISKVEKNQLDNLAIDAKNMLIDCNMEHNECLHFATGFFNSQYGMCVTVNSPPTHKIQSGGPVEGLSMLLDVDFENYLPTSDSVGVKVFVHHPNKSYDMESSGIYAAAGSRTAVALKLLNTTKLGPPYGKCYDEKILDEISKKHQFYFSGDYSVSGCMKTCLQKKVISQCGCMLMGHGDNVYGSDSLKYCWQTTLGCAISVQQNATENQEITLEKCGCLSPCHNMQYVTSISSFPWPSSHSAYSYYCYNPQNKCADNPLAYYRENILKLEVFFDTLNYNQYIERPDYTLVDLFTDFGGNLGLFLGASVITCLEGFSLSISMLLWICGSKTKNVEKKCHSDERCSLTAHKCKKEMNNVEV